MQQDRSAGNITFTKCKADYRYKTYTLRNDQNLIDRILRSWWTDTKSENFDKKKQGNKSAFK